MYAQPDHRFCRRWAVLTDPEETLGASGAGIKVGMGVTVLCTKKSINHEYHIFPCNINAYSTLEVT